MSQKQKRVFWPILAAAVLSIGALVFAHGRTPRQTSVIQPPRGAPEVAPSKPSADKHVQSEVVMLTPWGFEPAKLTRAKGAFFLIVGNRTNLSGPNLDLDREAGGRLRQDAVDKRTNRSASLLDLEPGHYVLSEASHPAWVCNITITAN